MQAKVNTKNFIRYDEGAERYSMSKHSFMKLAQEFGVSIRTIQYDIQALTPVYPIYTKQGENGGIFIREDYKPYANSLTPMEVAALHELYDWTEGIHKKVLFQVLRKYGPDKLQL